VTELLDIYQDECAKLRQELYKTIHEIGEIKANAGLVVHALDCALALTEQLFIFLPEGTALPGGITTCKHSLDAALAKIFRPPAAQELVGDAATQDEKNKRLRNALVVAAANIATLNDQAHEMIRALNAAVQLVDGLVGEMAAKGVQPTPVLIALHNQFTREMNTVFKVPGMQKHTRKKLVS
jgi:hypothetical protein